MKSRKSLDSVGWLGSAGFQTIIDEEAREAAKVAKKKIAREHGNNGNNGSFDKKIKGR